MKIYIDESNTSGSKFEPDHKKLISAGAWIWNKEDEETCFNLFGGKEIKSSDLMTQRNNSLMEKLFNNINPNHFINFSSNFRMLYMLDLSYMIFYPNVLEGYYDFKTEELRNKICVNLVHEQFTFLSKPVILTRDNIYHFRMEILQRVQYSRHFSTDEIELLGNFFSENVQRISYSGNDLKINPHSTIIGKLIKTVYSYAKETGTKEMKFIVDKFTNLDVAEDIEEVIRATHKKMFGSLEKLSIKYKKSKYIPGLWLADLAASVPRKAMGSILDGFDFTGDSVKTHHKNSNHLAFNIEVMKWFLYSYGLHIQLPRMEMGLAQHIFHEDTSIGGLSLTQIANKSFTDYLDINGYLDKKTFDEMQEIIKNKGYGLDKIKLSEKSEEELLLENMRNFIFNNLDFKDVDNYNLRSLKKIAVKYLRWNYLKELQKENMELQIIFWMYAYMKTGDTLSKEGLDNFIIENNYI